jgi:hypothetical protein
MADMTSPFSAEQFRIVHADFDRSAIAGTLHAVRLGPKGEIEDRVLMQDDN